MKKRVFSALGIALLLLGGVTGCGTDTADTKDLQQTEDTASAQNTDRPDGGTTDHAQTRQSTDSLLTEEEVKQIALQDAGVEESEVSGIRIRLERDDGQQEYSVEFYAGNREYDYEVDAVSGTIRDRDMDIEEDFHSDAGSSQEGEILSVSQAKEIVQKQVKGVRAEDIRIHLDHDDGRQIYEGSLVFQDTEYDFEIDASDGSILEWEEESVYDD